MTFLMLLTNLILKTPFYSDNPPDKRIKIAVLDTGVNNNVDHAYLCSSGHLDLTNKGLFDRDGHGSNIFSIITRYISPSTHCIIVIKIFHYGHADSNDGNTYRVPYIEMVTTALKRATDMGAHYINMSFTSSAYVNEYIAFGKALNKGVILISAAGNDGKDISHNCNIYPACYYAYHPLNIIAGNNHASSNYGNVVTRCEDAVNVRGAGEVMTGTSQAAAMITGKLAGRIYDIYDPSKREWAATSCKPRANSNNAKRHVHEQSGNIDDYLHLWKK